MLMTQLYSSHSDIGALNENNNTAQKIASDWFISNQLSLNIDKTAKLNFSLKSISRNEDPVKFLGIYMEKNLTWKTHVFSLANKLLSIVFLLRKLAQYAPTDICRVAYMGLFQSQILYGVILWGNSSEWLRIFKLQKMAVRVITKSSSRVSCKPLFIKQRIMTLTALFVYSCLIHIKNNENKYIQQTSVHDYETRNCKHLLLPQHRLTVTHRNFIYMSVRIYNHIPMEIKYLTLNRFKCKMKEVLIQMAPYDLNEFFNASFPEM